jgi:hypothetical protein
VGNCARRSAVSSHGFENPIPWSRVTQEFCANHTTRLKELEAEARSHNGQDDRQAYTDHSFHSQRMLDGARYDSNTIGVLQFSCAMKKKYTNSNHHRRCLLDRFILVSTNNIVPISDVVRESGDPRA